ncbi:MAG: hypothetical protein ACT452_20515 [Microthrixaceae bacterium]
MTDTTDISATAPEDTGGLESVEAPHHRAGLQPVSTTAARERARLEARRGRSGPLALVSQLLVGVRHLGSEEAATSGLRYQPIAWMVIAIVAISGIFPGRPDVARLTGEHAQTPTSRDPSATTPTTVGSTPPGSAPLDTGAFSYTYTPPAASESPFFNPPDTVPPSTPTTLPPEATVPLAVRGFGWAGSLSGTALSTATVPSGRMPVGARAGSLDKVTFLRLRGTTDILTLVEDTAGAREALGAGAVRACAITEATWSEHPDQALADAPAIDTDHCAEGVESAGNTWTFDLSSFATRTSDYGFALLPTTSAPPDFQLTFKPS